MANSSQERGTMDHHDCPACGRELQPDDGHGWTWSKGEQDYVCYDLTDADRAWLAEANRQAAAMPGPTETGIETGIRPVPGL